MENLEGFRKLLADALGVLQELVADIDNTGGLVETEDGEFAPAADEGGTPHSDATAASKRGPLADEEWIDLAITYERAQGVLAQARQLEVIP